MKRIFTTLLAVVLLASCFVATVNAADPTMTNVTKWTYEENFDYADEAALAAADAAVTRKGTTDNQKLTFADGVMNVNSAVAANFTIRLNSDKFTESTDKFYFEFRAKMNFTDGRLSVIVFPGAGYRIHSQVKNGVINIQGTDGWHSITAPVNDNAYHTIRYEATITADGGSCNVFVDGAYVGTAPNLNANTGSTYYLFEANSPALVADIDYVKFSNVEQPVEPPVTPENPDTPSDDEDAPATGVAIVPMVLVATTALAGVVVSKKRR